VKRGGGVPDGVLRVAANKRALFKFSVVEKFEAGIQLTGTEVKSVRNRNVSFGDSHVAFRGRELYLVKLNISKYDPASWANHEPERPRRLLMHRQELDRLIPRLQQKGFSLVPAAIYFRNGWAKVELALVTRRTGADKRMAIRERENRRDVDRARKMRGRE
jgi:SsrA-binding protein